MTFRQILSVTALTALSSLLLASAAFAGPPCDQNMTPAPVTQQSATQVNLTDTAPSGGAFQRPTDVHELNIGSQTTANGINAPRKMKYVYKRPAFSSDVVYCRPVPPATKCDDGGFMGFVSGIFGARSTMMSAQPGFPRVTAATRLNVQTGYRPPVVAVPVD